MELVNNYTITEDPTFFDNDNEITQELRIQLEKCYELALSGKKSGSKIIQQQIEKFPDSPQLKNYLSVWYSNVGDIEKSYETNKWIVAEHPDYIFGKFNLVNEFFKNKASEKIPEILGKEMNLKALYPERDTFHIDEVTGFFSLAAKYYGAINKIEEAESQLKKLEEIAPDFQITSDTRLQLLTARMKHGFEFFQEREKGKIRVDVNTQHPLNHIENPPIFIHKEIEQLYQKGLYIEKEVLAKILSLPRISLLKDLEQVLEDSIKRHHFFSEKAEEEGWNEETMNFVIHAFFLLGELEAAEIFDSMLLVLEQSEEYLQFYFGDFLTELAWEPIYKAGKNELELLEEFVCEPGTYTYAKTEISKVIEQIALHHPDRKNEAVSWFRSVFDFYSKSEIEDNVIDGDTIGLMICNCIDFEAKELLPEIKKLFELNYVALNICGTYKDVESAFQKPSKFNRTQGLLGIIDRYEEVTSTWSGYNEKQTNTNHFHAYDSLPAIQPVRSEPKIGRNASCPCGSSKKYKKCCL